MKLSLQTDAGLLVAEWQVVYEDYTLPSDPPLPQVYDLFYVADMLELAQAILDAVSVKQEREIGPYS